LKTLALTLLAGLGLASGAAAGDPLAPWRDGVQIQPACPDAPRHTFHSYFNTCPESPDGKHLLFFTSTTADGHLGEVRMLERATGKETVLGGKILAEDAHRVACQQWVSGGRRVVFHGERDGQWIVVVVDVATGRERVLAQDRLAGWGQPDADAVPLYGRHWNPGAHRDLELVDVASGEIRTVVTKDAVQAKYPEWLAKRFGEKPVSIFFPVLSPDRKRIFFKMAAAGTVNDPRSGAASQREGLVCYSLEQRQFLFLREQWGHPAWHPDQRTIVEAGNLLFDSDTGKSRRIPELPGFRGDHPSASPDGQLIVTDTTLEKFGGTAKEWGVVVFDIRGTNHVILQRFDNSKGARSWRVSHPHPIFSPDGRRIYFNASSGRWTELRVAQRGDGKPGAGR
jgi:hypothetical protein